ncbi:MAG: ABC transporter substrate-binding protein [Candidatus Nitrosocosmicus sp.]|nr:ABC transporter substrate-binding protein [Candidatus Nitrosocosmicus sp.]MDN5866558.1 ABC transporter substrate-binding protein [Candidatus Nitrosocosmicus sp.]
MDSKAKLGISFAIIIAVILSSNFNFNWSFLLGQDKSTTGSTSQSTNAKADSLKIGYFPNLNHAQAIIGLNNGDFEKVLVNDKNLGNISLKEFVFTAGPSAIEALYAGQIDVAYVGPSPAINGYVVTGGEGLRIISGASSGGASFIVRNDSGIETVEDLGGKKFASPQLGNTQDVALRKYLIDNGFNTVENGGNVTVVAAKPADIITLFLKKEIDGAWVPEPVGAILKEQGKGFILVDERDLWPPEGKFVTANILARTDYLKDNPEIVKKLLEVHVDETLWINQKLSKTNDTEIDEENIQELTVAFNEGLEEITGKTYPEDQIKDALSRIEFTYDPISASLNKIAEDANDLGYINLGSDGEIDLESIYDLSLLNEVLKSKGLNTVP